MYLSDLIKGKFRKSILCYKSIVYIHTKWPNNSALQKKICFFVLYMHLQHDFQCHFQRLLSHHWIHYSTTTLVERSALPAACWEHRLPLDLPWFGQIQSSKERTTASWHMNRRIWMRPPLLYSSISTIKMIHQNRPIKRSFFCVWIHVMFPWIVLINVGLIQVPMMFFCYYFFARIRKSCFCSTKLRINTQLFSDINLSVCLWNLKANFCLKMPVWLKLSLIN